MEATSTQLPDHVDEGFLLGSASVLSAPGALAVGDDGAEEGEIVADVTEPSGNKNGSKDKILSGLEGSVPTELVMDEPELCLPIKRVLTKRSSREKVAKELARCLQERKHLLVSSVVRVMGVNKALSLFNKTAEIQLNGGELTADGKRKKTPGGVFFTLVHKTSSAEECKRIFHDDKKITRQKKRERQLQRIMEMEARIQRLEDHELGERRLPKLQHKKNVGKKFSMTSADLTHSNDESCDSDKPAGTEATKDDLMLKCWKRSSTLPQSLAGIVEGMCQEGSTLFDGQRRNCQLASSSGRDGVERNESLTHSEGEGSCDEAMEVCFTQTEDICELDKEILAQQFDLTSEADLDFGIDFG